MKDLTNENVLQALKSQDIEAYIQKETDQVYTILKIESADYPLFIRILESGPILQFITFIPCTVDKKNISELSRTLHFINKEMDLPGFGIDENAKVVFYRMTLPSFDKKFNPKEIEKLIKTIKLVCESFPPLIINVAQGTISYKAVVEMAKKGQIS